MATIVQKSDIRFNRPKRITFLFFVFLIISLIVIFNYISGIYSHGLSSFKVYSSYTLFFEILFYLVPILLASVTFCFFNYSKLSMRLVTPLMVTLALIVVYLSQGVFSVVYLRIWDMDLMTFDKLTIPDALVQNIKGDPAGFAFKLANFNMLLVGVFFGFPFLLVYIINKIISYKTS